MSDTEAVTRRMASGALAIALASALAVSGCAVRTETPAGTAEPVPGAENQDAVQAIPPARSAGDAAATANDATSDTENDVDALTGQQ